VKRELLIQLCLVVCVTSILMGLIGCSEANKVPLTTSSEKALEDFRKGQALWDKMRLQDALPHFRSATEEDPEFAMVYVFRSFTEPVTTGFYENFEKAKALIDDVSEGERLWILGVEAGVYGRVEEQLGYLTKLVELYPEDERVHQMLADHYMQKQDYRTAIEECNRVVGINPEFVQAYNQMGYAHRHLNNYDSAEIAFKRYISLIPEDPNPYDSYGELLLRMGKYDESIAQYRKALEADPEFFFSYVGIATNLCFQGKHDQARVELDGMWAGAEALNNDFYRRTTLTANAVTFVDEGRLGEAMVELERQYQIAKQADDIPGMSGDLFTMCHKAVKIHSLGAVFLCLGLVA